MTPAVTVDWSWPSEFFFQAGDDARRGHCRGEVEICPMRTRSVPGGSFPPALSTGGCGIRTNSTPQISTLSTFLQPILGVLAQYSVGQLTRGTFPEWRQCSRFLVRVRFDPAKFLGSCCRLATSTSRLFRSRNHKTFRC